MQGFFSEDEMVSKSLPMVGDNDRPKCGACGLFRKCESPKLAPFNAGRKKKFLIVAESPGEEEDREGRQLVGNSSKELAKALSANGVSLRQDCILTNALICRPKDNKITDIRQIDYCRPNLIKTLLEERPKVVLLLGMSAVRSVIPYLWKPLGDQDKMEIWSGWKIPSQKINAYVVPTYHPSFLLHAKSEAYQRVFDDNIRAACRLYRKGERPWTKERPVPYSEDDVEILSGEDAKNAIIKMTVAGKPIAFDYETNCLKPDNSYATIVCVGMSNGKSTIAFDLNEVTGRAFKMFLQSDVPKVGHNTKFEDRWSYRIFNTFPKNVIWCGMNNAHILDARSGITSLKFQSFVRFGQTDYDSAVKPYLIGKPDTGYGRNRILECPRPKLLKYCGMDALLEYHEVRDQNREAGFPVEELV